MKNIAYDLPKSRIPRNINPYTLFRLIDTGAEIEVMKTDTNRKGLHRINPIEKLYKNNKLSEDERGVALNYQHQFHLAGLSDHARPSYDGTTVSSIVLKSGEKKSAAEAKSEARLYVDKVKELVTMRFNYEPVWTNGKCEIVELFLPTILQETFEQEIKITNSLKKGKTYHKLDIDRPKAEERIKKICKIMLDMEKKLN
jgi:hypothetical protein